MQISVQLHLIIVYCFKRLFNNNNNKFSKCKFLPSCTQLFGIVLKDSLSMIRRHFKNENLSQVAHNYLWLFKRLFNNDKKFSKF